MGTLRAPVVGRERLGAGRADGTKRVGHLGETVRHRTRPRPRRRQHRDRQLPRRRRHLRPLTGAVRRDVRRPRRTRLQHTERCCCSREDHGRDWDLEHIDDPAVRTAVVSERRDLRQAQATSRYARRPRGDVASHHPPVHPDREARGPPPARAAVRARAQVWICCPFDTERDSENIAPPSRRPSRQLTPKAAETFLAMLAQGCCSRRQS